MVRLKIIKVRELDVCGSLVKSSHIIMGMSWKLLVCWTFSTTHNEIIAGKLARILYALI